MAFKIEGGTVHKSLTLQVVMDLVEQDNNLGACIDCGEVAYGVEPDARHYTCESCGNKGVYGAEELLLFMA